MSARRQVKPGYESLATVLDDALAQAQLGKGSERHASKGESFEDQQIVQIGEWMESTAFCIGQACKKAIESSRLPGAKGEAELLGAINYLAGAVVLLRRRAERANKTGALVDRLTDEFTGSAGATATFIAPNGEPLTHVKTTPWTSEKTSAGMKAEAAAFNHWQETLKGKVFVGAADSPTRVGKNAPSLGTANDDSDAVKTEIRAAEISIFDLDDAPDELTQDEHDGVRGHRAGWHPLEEELAGWLACEIREGK